MRNLIVTGDDFGLAVPVNEAIEEAHRNGILTTASLMVGAAASQDAIDRALRMPTLRVGLHLVLVEGRPVLPPEMVPGLVDRHGRFSTNLFGAGCNFFFRPGISRQLEHEIWTQFNLFRKTGLVLDHVNSHNHMHLHPTVLKAVLTVGREFGLRAVRLPYEPLLPALKACGNHHASRLLRWALLWPWIRRCRTRIRDAGMACNDFVFGLHDSGHLKQELFERFVHSLPHGVTEIYCHPATRRCPEIDDTMADYEHEAEFRALLSSEIKTALLARGVRRYAFGEMQPQ
jgi:hopanoid biosynthesis associated protein HpnK